jgi:hypothetical protein
LTIITGKTWKFILPKPEKFPSSLASYRLVGTAKTVALDS